MASRNSSAQSDFHKGDVVQAPDGNRYRVQEVVESDHGGGDRFIIASSPTEAQQLRADLEEYTGDYEI